MQTISYLPLKDEKKGTTCIPKGPPSPEISTVLVISLKKKEHKETHLICFHIEFSISKTHFALNQMIWSDR